MLRQEQLDDLWNFADPQASESRLRSAAAMAPDGVARAELLTQVARALGLQGRFDQAHVLLDELEREQPHLDDSLDNQDHDEHPVGRAVVGVRIALERGRVVNSAAHAAAEAHGPARGSAPEATPVATVPAVPERGAAVEHFRLALERAKACGADFLTLDALHMLAIADAAGAANWTDEALALAEAHPDARTRRWAVALHNNRGWDLVDAGQLPQALTAFERAYRAADAVGTDEQRQHARAAIEECQAALAAQEEPA